jgi:hypothetical protein
VPTERHPLGRSCALTLPLVLLLMPYALARYAIDQRRARKAARRG